MQASAISRRKKRTAATIRVRLLIQLTKAVRGATVRGRLLNEGGV